MVDKAGDSMELKSPDPLQPPALPPLGLSLTFPNPTPTVEDHNRSLGTPCRHHTKAPLGTHEPMSGRQGPRGTSSTRELSASDTTHLQKQTGWNPI